MGAEGVPWIGLAPFVDEPHLIQNIGDGTLSHSGTLAIRASVAAGVNITFKILYNAAVAMTGGQDVTGLMDVPAITRALEAEGVRRIVVCADDPKRYGRRARWAAGRARWSGATGSPSSRTSCAAFPGVTVIVYDQRCAAEARRLRKSGLLEEPPRRVVINEAVCEGCGDCSTKSNCLSVLPARHRVRREAPDPRLVVQPRLHVPRGRLSLVRHDHRQRRRRAHGTPPPGSSGVDSGVVARGRAAAPGAAVVRRAVQHLLHRDRRDRRGHRQPHRRRRGRGGRATSSAGWTRPGCRRRPARSSRTCTWRRNGARSGRPRWARSAPTSTCRATSCRPRARAISGGSIPVAPSR